MSDIRADVNVLKEGYVFKLAGFFRKTWEPRYFRLRGRQLLYYKNETDGTPRQSLCLRGAKAFRAAEGKISARTDFCVEIQLVEPFLKSYYFCTDSEDTLNQWVDALNSASAYRVQETVKLKGHEEKITCSAYSPDGKRLITGTLSGCLKVWDLKLCKLILSLEAHRNEIRKLGYCNDGHRVFSISTDKTIKIWDSATFQSPVIIGCDDAISDCAECPESKQLIVGTESGVIKVISSESMKTVGVLKGHKSAITSISTSISGRRVLTTSSDGTVICWVLSHPQSPVTVIRHPYTPVHGIISPDGKRFALWDREQSVAVYQWEDSISPKYEMNKHSEAITTCIFSPNSGKLLTSSRDRSILIWDCALSGQLLADLNAQIDAVRHCDISRNQQLMISVAGQTVSLWDFNSMELIKVLEHKKQVLSASFIPDYSGIVCQFEDGIMQVWSL